MDISDSRKKKIRIIYFALFLVPILIGTQGQVINGTSIDDALFNCVLMYTWGYDEAPANVYVSIARWIAPLMTIGGIAYAFSAIRFFLWNLYCYCFGNRIAIYGDYQFTEELKKEYGKTTVIADDPEKHLIADTYILLMSNKDNVRFYKMNSHRLKNAIIYMCGDRFKQLILEDSNVRVFCPEENAARSFWKNQDLFEDIQEEMSNGKPLRIVLIGFGELGENLIYWGLQHNLYDPEQMIEYHVFGEDRNFSEIYHESANGISDKVFFHEEGWLNNLELLNSANRIVLCEQDNQDAIVQEFIYAVPIKKIHVFLSENSIFDQVNIDERVITFKWKDIAYGKESVLTDRLYLTAKKINYQYALQYGDSKGEDPIKEMDAEWDSISAFSKYSNLSAADFLENVHLLINHWGYKTNSAISAEKIGVLTELEHMRWCRFHYLNNWKYGIPENGKNKDAQKRIHKCLVPFSELDEDEKKKDTANILMLLSIEL